MHLCCKRGEGPPVCHSPRSIRWADKYNLCGRPRQWRTSVDTRPSTCCEKMVPTFTVALSSWQATFLSPDKELRIGQIVTSL